MLGLQATVDRFENDQAVLRFQGNQELVVPIEVLPVGTSEGGVVEVSFGLNNKAEADSAQSVRDLLNQILQGK